MSFNISWERRNMLLLRMKIQMTTCTEFWPFRCERWSEIMCRLQIWDYIWNDAACTRITCVRIDHSFDILSLSFHGCNTDSWCAFIALTARFWKLISPHSSAGKWPEVWMMEWSFSAPCTFCHSHHGTWFQAPYFRLIPFSREMMAKYSSSFFLSECVMSSCDLRFVCIEHRNDDV